jgi:tetratricopeptide (TPR) repeat protein
MARSSRNKRKPRGSASVVLGDAVPKSTSATLIANAWIPLLLATATFLVYWPSLGSDFVYDARLEIEEGFITSLSHLPDVLSLKVLGMPLMLGDRPGQLLYLMSIAAICGKEPFGYHLCSNLLHAANVALLFVLLLHLAKIEMNGLPAKAVARIQLAAAGATLIFALHPLAVEAVAGVSYSSDLLVTFFTLLALLAAISFRPEKPKKALPMATLGTLSCFAAVACKESGLAAAGLLIFYWFLFRRHESKQPWLCFLGAALAVTGAFLAARFLLAPPSPGHSTAIAGSFSGIFLVQPRLWVFMMGKLLWPVSLSADYTLEDLGGITTPVAWVILIIVLSLQAWLAARSRLGALGVAIYWLGLVTVSNFVPLYRILGDRFYYLPLAGVAMQLTALLLMTVKFRDGYWAAITPCLVVLLPLTLLTRAREDVFTNEFTLWNDTVQASPFSSIAHNDFGDALVRKGDVDEAMAQYEIGEKLDPNNSEIHNNLGSLLSPKGRVDEAIAEYQKAFELGLNDARLHYNLAIAFAQRGRLDDAINQYLEALKLNPNLAEAHNNLGNVLMQKGRVAEAVAQYEEVLQLKPGDPSAENNLVAARTVAARKSGSK